MINKNFILILGESTGVECFKKLIKSEVKSIRYVISTNKIYNIIIRNICKKNKIIFYNSKNFERNKIRIKNTKKDKFILLSIFSNLILKEKFLKKFKKRCYNIHPGILPFYPGKNCVSGSIYNLEKMNGVTLHLMTAKVDQGPIIMKKIFKINKGKETLLSLMVKLKKSTIILLNEFIFSTLDKNKIITYKNNIKKQKYFPKFIPNGGQINLDWSFKYFDKIFRAANSGPYCNSWGSVFFKYKNIKKKIISYESLNKKKNLIFTNNQIKIENDHFILKLADRIIRVRVI